MKGRDYLLEMDKQENYVIRFKGAGLPDEASTRRIHEHPSIEVIDESPSMMLVRTSKQVADDLKAHLSNWLVVPEQYTPLPDTRHKVKQSP